MGDAFVIAIVLVVFGAEKILSNTFATVFFFQLHLTIVLCLLMVPILSGIAYAIPKYQFKKMSQESVVVLSFTSASIICSSRSISGNTTFLPLE